MGKMVGYMVTWTTYGTWLQGDNRRYVKDGEILEPDENIYATNKKLQKSKTVRFTKEERNIIQRAILQEAEKIGQKIEALAVCANHVHIAARPCKPFIEDVVSRYKNIAMFALEKQEDRKRIWTRSFDKQFCFTEEHFSKAVEYVRKHNNSV